MAFASLKAPIVDVFPDVPGMLHQYLRIDLSRLVYVWGRKMACCTIVWTRLNFVPGVVLEAPQKDKWHVNLNLS